MLSRLIIFLLTSVAAFSSLAQQRCSTVEYEKMLRERNPKKESVEQFEKWMYGKMKTVKSSPFGAQQTQSTYLIPVVVHVIHNNEPIGTGVNISDEQINSQIKVLNDDFNRLNSDKANTFSIFQSVAGSFDIQFVLAKQDPDGLTTTGIVRKKGPKTTWNYASDNAFLKSQSYWPAEQYVNIWVTALSSGDLGFAQLPISTLLSGLEDSSPERLTDGIVINYREFGTKDAGSFDLAPRYSKGRTLTHEMGHFFGLRHIWGDNNGNGTECTSTDYVDDTPIQNNYTSGCITSPQSDCATTKMSQNYLDYTDDACMNLFTQGQVNRMNTVIQNSPRRKELPNSAGSQPATAVANDLGIRSILNPSYTSCNGSIVPSILIRNYGTNSVNTAQLQFQLNGMITETKAITSSILIGSEQQLNFSPVSVTNSNSYQFEFFILSTNGTTDGKSSNNYKVTTTTIPANGTLPIAENFSSFPIDWNIENPDGLISWQTTSVSSRSAIYMDFYNYSEVGAIDRLITPILDLTSATSATLIFDRAYAQYSGSNDERLRVLGTSTCSFDNSSPILFDRSGYELSTAPPASSSFVPKSNQWITEVVSLNSFVGQRVQLSFEATNGSDNNLYLSNVKIITGALLDLSLLKLESPSPVSCESNPLPTIRVRNIGNVPIQSFTANVKINNGNLQSEIFSGFSINPNEEKVFQLKAVQLNSGSNQFTVFISNPNGKADDNPQNNSLDYKLVLNTSQDIIPLREKFDGNSQLKWSIVSQGNQQPWAKSSTNYANSLFYNSYANTSVGDESWLVSPILDFRNASRASMFFDASYAYLTGNDQLKVLASTDCGTTFNESLFNESGSQLSVVNSDTSWLPSLSQDWRRNHIDLDQYVGQPTMRFAFVVTNGNGNNLYLDNIDFFTDDNPQPVLAENPYSIYGGIGTPPKITFSLDERQPVRLLIYNSIGQQISDNLLLDTINQTYTIELPENGSGIYIVQVQIGDMISAKKVFVGN
jgi:Pregnancy-associated plasma protein-A